ncbi:MAG: D-alanine--D-alanine ligase family protein [Anaerolineales bacterium]
MDKLKLAVLFGGRSGEHEVSLMSARSVVSALDPSKYEIVEIGITKDGRWFGGEEVLASFERGDIQDLSCFTMLGEPEQGSLYLRHEDRMEKNHEIDAVFPVLHGSYGEDGTVQGLLELADIPYVGAGVLASAVAMDKALFKDVMRAQGIPVVDWVVFPSTVLDEDADAALDRAESIGGYPLFTKPANLGSSVGISRCNHRSDLIEGLHEAAMYDRRVIVEKGLDAREIEVSVLGNEDPAASVAGEIVPSDEFYTYDAKYVDDDSELIIPAPIDDATSDKARKLAVDSYKAIDGAGMARVDFLLDRASGELFMNEINTIPGFTSISMYPKLWEATGLEYGDLLDKLIELAFQRQDQKDKLVRTYGERS